MPDIERVEEIRRTFNFDPWALGVGDTRVLLEHIESLTAALAQAERENERLRERHEDTLTTLQETAKAAIRAEARTRALEAALTPFAKRAEYFDRRMKADGAPWADDDVYADDPPSDIYLGHLRAARAALTEPPPPAGPA